MADTTAPTESPLALRQKLDAELITFDPAKPPADFAAAMASASEAGLTEVDAHVILDPYTALNQDKDALIDRPFVIQHVKFMTDKITNANYCNMWVVRDDNALFRVTDGSTGLYVQVSGLVADRLARNTPAPYGPFIVDNGLRKSEYGVDKNGKTVELGDPTLVSKAATYYLA